jgi:hypothetical protein
MDSAITSDSPSVDGTQEIEYLCVCLNFPK